MCNNQKRSQDCASAIYIYICYTITPVTPYISLFAHADFFNCVVEVVFGKNRIFKTTIFNVGVTV